MNNSYCLFLRFSVAMCLFGFASGCCSFTDGVSIYVAPHNLPASCLRKQPYESHMKDFVPKPDPPNDLEYVDFMLLIYNNLQQDLFFHEEKSSFGYDNFSIKIKTRTGKTFVLTKKAGVWYRNVPTKIIVPPHTFLVLPISLDSSIWQGIPNLEIGEEFQIMATMFNGFVVDKGTVILAKPRVITSEWTSLLFRQPRIIYRLDNQ